jgi:hypothetical protein
VVAGEIPKHVCGVHRCELPVKRPFEDGHWGDLETNALCFSPPKGSSSTRDMIGGFTFRVVQMSSIIAKKLELRGGCRSLRTSLFELKVLTWYQW